MSELPRGWVGATVRDILCVLETGSVIDQGWSPRCENFPSKDETTWGALKTTAIQDGRFEQEHTKQLPPHLTPRPQLEVSEGDLLMTCAGPRARCGIICQVGRVRRKLFISGKMYRFKADERIATSQFILGVLRSRDLQQAIDVIKTGGSDSGLNLTQDRFKGLNVPLPPLPEQKRIVAKLDTLNAKSARARTELARIETLVSRYKQAVLTKAFSGVLDRKELGELVVRIKAGKNLRCEERPPHSNEKGVVKVSAVTWGEFRADQSKTLPSDFEPDENTRIRLGDFLFSRANTIELVGAVVIVANAPDNLYLSDKILRLEFSEPVDAWLLWYLRSPVGREALMNISSGNQLSMRNIGQKSLLSLSVPYAEAVWRNKIVRHIESAFAKIDRLAAEAKRALELVGRLDEAILAKAFRGELVPQDENDEPAEHLLARIRAERESAPKAKGGRGAKR